MRQAVVYFNNIPVGTLTESDDGKYIFKYDASYLADKTNRAISLTLPKRGEEYISETLFPFFCNMLSEGANRAIQCKTLKIDENDTFGLLLATAGDDTIGAVTIKSL